MSVWSNVLFNLAVILNLIVAFFYLFDGQIRASLGTLVDRYAHGSCCGRRFVQTIARPNSLRSALGCFFRSLNPTLNIDAFCTIIILMPQLGLFAW